MTYVLMPFLSYFSIVRIEGDSLGYLSLHRNPEECQENLQDTSLGSNECSSVWLFISWAEYMIAFIGLANTRVNKTE